MSITCELGRAQEGISIACGTPNYLNGAPLPAIYGLGSYLSLTMTPIPWITGPYLQYV